MINNFVMGIKENSKNWISKDLLYTQTSKGGFGMIKLEDFMKAIKVAWIKRYCIDMIDDHWADIIDEHYKLSTCRRKNLLEFGPERFNKIFKEEIPVIRNLFQAYKTFKHNFPTSPDTFDNSWLNQCAFYNLNITRKQPNTKQRTFLKPTFYGIPDKYHTLALKEFFQSGSFITNEALNTLTESKVHPLQYANLKHHIKNHIGHNKKYDAIPKENLPQKKYTYVSTTNLMASIPKGSGTYRKIIGRGQPLLDIHNPGKWNKRLNTTHVTHTHIKKCLMNLHSPYIDSSSADHLSRLKLCKTLFNSQLFSIGKIDENVCKTCKKELNVDIIEDYKHAMYLCPTVQSIIASVTSNFFTNINTPFDIIEVLTAVITDKHQLYLGQDGQKLASTIWDLLQVYIIKCHSSELTPNPINAIFEIRSQLNRVMKILPNTRLSRFITHSKPLLEVIECYLK